MPVLPPENAIEVMNVILYQMLYSFSRTYI